MSEDILYHYCSLDTFLSIIKNKTIRLSDINKSNDYLETKALLEIIKEEAIKLYDKYSITYDGTLINGMTNRDAISYMIDIEIKKIYKLHDILIYAACLSENGDLLSQWRGYADNGNGVSIGFDLNSLIELSKTDQLELRKVVYVSAENNRNNKKISKYANMILNSVLGALEHRETKDLFCNQYGSDSYSHFIQKSLILNSIFLKHNSFREEREWRIVFKDELSKFDGDWNEKYNWEGESLDSPLKKLFPKAMQFRSAGNDIVSYLDLCFAPFIDDIISKIYIGPNCKMDIGDVYQLLNHFRYNVPEESIIKSESTYRQR